MKLDFYYWGSMCPIANEILYLLNTYKSKIDVHVYDITNNTKLAKQENIFFPFLTVVNDEYRFYSPISESFLKALLKGEIPQELPYRISLGNIEKTANIEKITYKNYSLASQCTDRKNCLYCNEKVHMYSSLKNEVIGFMNVEGNSVLGGAEFYPSLYVPYDIPKAEDIAFITCVYLSDEDYDYKSAPLKALENYLSQQYKYVEVITDEIGTFPNGNLDFFKQHAYHDDGVIFEDAYCKLHLMSKKLLQ